jgi:hypothetical protein
MQKSTALSRLWHALAAHEHTLIDQHLEHTHGPGFVQAAFVATDGHTIGRIFEYRTTFFALVMQSVGGDFGFLVVAHGLILYLCVKKIYVFFGLIATQARSCQLLTNRRSASRRGAPLISVVGEP